MNTVQGSKAFIGVAGIDVNEGMTLPWSHEAELASIMMRRCKETIVLADYAKFGRLSLYKIDYKLSDVYTIISDKKIEKKYIESFTKNGLHIIRADD